MYSFRKRVRYNLHFAVSLEPKGLYVGLQMIFSRECGKISSLFRNVRIERDVAVSCI